MLIKIEWGQRDILAVHWLVHCLSGQCCLQVKCIAVLFRVGKQGNAQSFGNVFWKVTKTQCKEIFRTCLLMSVLF